MFSHPYSFPIHGAWKRKAFSFSSELFLSSLVSRSISQHPSCIIPRLPTLSSSLIPACLYHSSDFFVGTKNFIPLWTLNLKPHLVIFKSLSCCFEETIGLDVKASFVSRPMSRLIRWYNKPGDITKEFWEKAIPFHKTFHGLKITNWPVNSV